MDLKEQIEIVEELVDAAYAVDVDHLGWKAAGHDGRRLLGYLKAQVRKEQKIEDSIGIYEISFTDPDDTQSAIKLRYEHFEHSELTRCLQDRLDINLTTADRQEVTIPHEIWRRYIVTREYIGEKHNIRQ